MMPQGSKQKYTEKQKRKAEKIESGYRDKGVPKEEAEARAWATVNKQSGGGERTGGSGQATSTTDKASARRSSARHAVETRQGKSLQGALEQKSKDELLREARRQNIKSRSTMRKQELVTALRRSA